jgi:hypothetical protein
LSRTHGVSPETIYFSAAASTCADCTDILGFGTEQAASWNELSYHFNFDDEDAGSFATTGKAKNSQLSGSPRAFHTFSCSGEGDPNWDSGHQHCVFNVGVRVQAKDGDYDDAFVEITIQPLYGPGGYYDVAEIWCVSSDSDYADCPHSNADRHLTDSPAVGSYDGQLVLFERGSSGTYSPICVGADESNVTVATYGEGDKPVVSRIQHSTRPSTCLTAYTDTSISTVAASQAPERDMEGNLINGYAFNGTYSGLRVGSINNGPSYHLANFHDLDMDWEADASYNGEIVVLTAAWNCKNSPSLDCNYVPYALFGFYTEIKAVSSASNLAPVNIACFDGCGITNFVFAGVETNRSYEHNARFMGAWGTIFSNNWFRGNHVGGNNGKERLTVRPVEATGTGGGTEHDLDRNPELLDGVNNYRANQSIDDYYNRYNLAIDNLFNQPTHDANHESAAMLHLGGNFGGVYGNTFLADDSGDTPFQTQFTGRYIVVRQTQWVSGYPDCSLRTGFYANNTAYNNAADIYVEAPASCSGGFDWPANTTGLSYGDTPGTE